MAILYAVLLSVTCMVVWFAAKRGWTGTARGAVELGPYFLAANCAALSGLQDETGLFMAWGAAALAIGTMLPLHLLSEGLLGSGWPTARARLWLILRHLGVITLSLAAVGLLLWMGVIWQLAVGIVLAAIVAGAALREHLLVRWGKLDGQTAASPETSATVQPVSDAKKPGGETVHLTVAPFLLGICIAVVSLMRWWTGPPGSDWLDAVERATFLGLAPALAMHFALTRHKGAIVTWLLTVIAFGIALALAFARVG